jgi:hypothetical protein
MQYSSTQSAMLISNLRCLIRPTICIRRLAPRRYPGARICQWGCDWRRVWPRPKRLGDLHHSPQIVHRRGHAIHSIPRNGKPRGLQTGRHDRHRDRDANKPMFGSDPPSSQDGVRQAIIIYNSRPTLQQSGALWDNLHRQSDRGRAEARKHCDGSPRH